ncbi:hypothetical protein JKP88DRAFT_253537 [Tribonema minus]|uniref:Uncharacterized protein n=1 Tax=Tribonema minus TaxID=303371 RepID=A0A835ZG51_9STRA|nr:hypothetical protein JKP88DRAFT_253537 [Tribonema minus]
MAAARGQGTAYWFQALHKDHSFPAMEVYTRITTAACTVENTKDAVWRWDAKAIPRAAPFIFVRLEKQQAIAAHLAKVLQQFYSSWPDATAIIFTPAELLAPMKFDAMGRAPAQGAPLVVAAARAGGQVKNSAGMDSHRASGSAKGHWNGYVLLIKFLLHRELSDEHDQRCERALASGKPRLSSKFPYCMDSPLNDVGAVSSGLHASAFLLGDTVDAAVVPEENKSHVGVPYYILYIETKAPANSNNIKKCLTNLQLPESPHHRAVIEDAYVFLENKGQRPAPTITARPELMAAMLREEQAHQQLLMIEAAEAVVAQASAGTVLSIEDVSHELAFTRAELTAGLQNIAVQRAQDGVGEQKRKLEAYQAEHLRLVDEIKELEPEVQRKRGLMAGYKAELAGKAAAYNEIQAQLKVSRRTLWRACRAHDFKYHYD